MKLLAGLAMLTVCALAQDAPKPTATAKPSATADPTATPEKKDETPEPPATEVEAKFKMTLTNATMSGRWCLIKDGELTPEKPDKYSIVGVNKLFGDRWLIRARIQYGEKDYTAPIPVRVKWAGDTPVITVTDVGVPGGASYSARVVIYNDSYAGVWSGGAVRGLLNGMITREKQ
jgi:hypothetical protein